MLCSQMLDFKKHKLYLESEGKDGNERKSVRKMNIRNLVR